MQDQLAWREIEVGANPGCEDEAFEDVVNACRDAVPSIAIVWRATDIQSSRILPKFPDQGDNKTDAGTEEADEGEDEAAVENKENAT